MKTLGKILLSIVASLLGLVLVVIIGYNAYLRIAFNDFYSSARSEGKVVGLSDGLVPQGSTYVPEEKTFVSSGYMKDHSASRIYFYTDNKNPSFVTLKTPDGKDDITHAGGVAYWNGYIFLTSGKNVNVYSWEDIKSASQKGESVSFLYEVSTDYQNAFCHIEGDTLYVGEFYHETAYPTDSSHHFTTDGGEKHHAIITLFDLNQIKNSQFKTATPIKAYTVTDFAQGMCITETGRICITTSYSFKTSHIYVYEPIYNEKPDGEMTVNGQKVPLYYLDVNHLQDDIKFAPMSEELVYVDGRVYTLNESASAKYIFGKLCGGEKIYSIEIE